MSLTRTTLALAGICAAVGLGMQVHAQQPTTPAAGKEAAAKAPAGKEGAAAVVKMTPTQGNNARGEITFTQMPNGVHIVGSFTGLAYGEHGFQIGRAHV